MRSTFIILISMVTIAASYGQTTHNLLATDYYYSPDTLYIQPNDTVDVSINGYHSVTEIDSVDWVNNVDNHNGGFDVGFGSGSMVDWFIINTAGTYYYICEPHAAMGMKGVIIVGNGLNIQDHFDQNNFSVVQSSNGQINLSYVDANQIDVFDLTGKHVFNSSLEVSSKTQQINCNLPKGTYIFRFSKDKKLRVSKKAMLVK